MHGAEPKYFPYLNEINKNAITKYMKYYFSEISRNDGTNNTTKSILSKIIYLTKKDYNKINYDDLINITNEFAETSWETAKMKFRAFLRYYNIKFSEEIKINQKRLQQHKILEDDCLTKEEINKLINTPKRLDERAIMELYIVSGGRRTEIAKLRIKDIREDINYIEITLNKKRRNSNKTKTRTLIIVANPNNPIAIYPKNLINFLHNHPYKEQPEKPIFYSRFYPEKHINPATVNKMIERISKNSKINKHIFPHLIRHTSASFDGLVLPLPMFIEKYGWDKDSKEVERYCKPSKQMKIDFLLKKAGINPEEVNKCPRCQEINSINSERCKKCNSLLGNQLILDFENKLNRNNNLISELSKSKNENNKLMRLHKQNQKDIKYLKNKINLITNDTDNILNKIAKSITFVFYTNNPKIRIKLNEFISKNPNHTQKQLINYLNKDFIKFQESKDFDIQLKLYEKFLKIL